MDYAEGLSVVPVLQPGTSFRAYARTTWESLSRTIRPNPEDPARRYQILVETTSLVVSRPRRTVNTAVVSNRIQRIPFLSASIDGAG